MENSAKLALETPRLCSDSSDNDDEDETWDDWLSDSLTKQPCKSLFEDTILSSVEEALHNDKLKHGFDLDETCARLSLDTHGRIRLINYVRKNRVSPLDVHNLTGTEPFLVSDEFLIPVIEDDPLLLIQQEWSESESDTEAENVDSRKRIQALQRQLASVKRDLADYRSFVTKGIDRIRLLEIIDAPQAVGLPKDDDTHYFQSYGENDIHAVMIQDKVRTSTYAHFILTNPTLFRDATVLDVGCGTGILSLFAARAGAKRVIAVDASDVAEKARRIVKANGLEDIITVIKGKVEDISLPDDVGKVDIIVSEWMGYALLYESMLDSVLHARERFLKPDGVMAPSQCRMILSLCDAAEIHKERIGFWNDVYGFDMSMMAENLYEEAIVDVIGPDALLSEPYIVKDITIKDAVTHQLDFSSSFTLTSTAEKRSKVNAFVLYFDAFFTASVQPVPQDTRVQVVKEGDVVLAELWPVGGKSAPKRRQSTGKENTVITSFSTGPRSVPTHWKQTLFLLQEPVMVTEGDLYVNDSFGQILTIVQAL
ncbi:hypothetical protein AX17_006282 [Amanita inopinata Kibby_2008]|nr:hypothetical protein AX17_006282 [Amanita inopinata Kibby_2008]